MSDKYIKIIEKYPGNRRENLIAALQDVQKIDGHISEEAINAISKQMKLPSSKIYGIATFYDEFTFQDRGLYHVKICTGTGCHLAGSNDILEEFCSQLNIEVGETTKDGMFSIETVPCMGACGLAPVVAVNNNYFTKCTVVEVKEILTSHINNEYEQGNA